MTYQRIFGRPAPVPSRHFSSGGLSVMLDERAGQAMAALVARTGETKTELLLRLLAGRKRSSKVARGVLVVEHCRLFGKLPGGRTLDTRERRWTPEVRRGYQDRYSAEWRVERPAGLDAARVAGRAAGARGALRAAGRLA